MQFAKIAELETQNAELSEKNSTLESHIKELSECGTAQVQADEDTEMSMEAETPPAQDDLLSQLTEARELAQKLQQEAETHARDTQQKDAMIISMGETVAELRVKLENGAVGGNNDNPGAPRSASDLLLLSDKMAVATEDTHTNEVSSQTDDTEGPAAPQKTGEDIKSLEEQLVKAREDLAGRL